MPLQYRSQPLRQRTEQYATELSVLRHHRGSSPGERSQVTQSRLGDLFEDQLPTESPQCPYNLSALPSMPVRGRYEIWGDLCRRYWRVVRDQWNASFFSRTSSS
jgi:hypothetical protein